MHSAILIMRVAYFGLNILDTDDTVFIDWWLICVIKLSDKSKDGIKE